MEAHLPPPACEEEAAARLWAAAMSQACFLLRQFSFMISERRLGAPGGRAEPSTAEGAGVFFFLRKTRRNKHAWGRGEGKKLWRGGDKPSSQDSPPQLM